MKNKVWSRLVVCVAAISTCNSSALANTDNKTTQAQAHKSTAAAKPQAKGSSAPPMAPAIVHKPATAGNPGSGPPQATMTSPAVPQSEMQQSAQPFDPNQQFAPSQHVSPGHPQRTAGEKIKDLLNNIVRVDINPDGDKHVHVPFVNVDVKDGKSSVKVDAPFVHVQKKEDEDVSVKAPFVNIHNDDKKGKDND